MCATFTFSVVYGNIPKSDIGWGLGSMGFYLGKGVYLFYFNQNLTQPTSNPYSLTLQLYPFCG